MSGGPAGAASGSSPLPPLYAEWSTALLGGPIPAETDATCEDCAMCPPPGRRPKTGVFFAPDVKCCSYMPSLPNFLVGRMLRDDDPAFAVGRRTIDARLAARVAVTPLGLGPTPAHTALYDRQGDRAFGQSRTLLCPHFVKEHGGRCAIWRYRNGVCATWFCKHVRGAVGLRFWQALEQLLAAVETQLGRWCVLELGVDADALHELFRQMTDRGATNAAWQRQARKWRRELRTSGYAILRDLFTPIFVAAVREHYRRLDRKGDLPRGADRRLGRPLIWDEPLLVFLGRRLSAVVGQVTRERAPSTFSFLRVYGSGAVLASHRDRPACRWNIDLVVGGNPPPERRTAWPLWIDGRQGRRAVRLGLGDGLLYRGTELRHWRRAQPAGRTTMLACFHYGRAQSRRPGYPAKTCASCRGR